MDNQDKESRGDGLVNPDKFGANRFEAKPPPLDFSKPLDPALIEEAMFPHRKAEREMQEMMRRNRALQKQSRGWLVQPKFIGLVVAGGLMALGYSTNGSLSTGWGMISLMVGLGVFAWMRKLESGS